MEGSSVTLICDSRGYKYPHSPNWFSCSGICNEFCTSSINHEGAVSSGCYVPDYHQLNFAHTNFLKNDEKLNEIVKISEQPTKGLTQILHYDKIHLDSFSVLLKCNADIQIVTEGYHDIINGIDFYNYTSKLLVLNVTLDSPYTKFKCQINDTFKEISFTVKGKRKRRVMPLE
jgi:hypothetical protein